MKKIQNKGITLIALVITIIILLILAGITIATLTGENGLLTKATQSKEHTQEGSAKEKIKLSIISSYETDGAFHVTTLKKEIKQYGGNIISENENTIVVEIDGYKEAIDVKTGRFKTLKEEQPILKAIYIGTRAFTVEVDTAGEEISKYSYYIDDEIKEKESNNNTFTIENLEPENTYRVKAIIEDSNGNIKELTELQIITQPFTYLYLNGDEFIELTGGFEGNITSGNHALGSTGTMFDGNGNYSSGTVTKNVDNIYLTAQHGNNSSIGITTVGIKNKKVINFSNYKKMYVEGSFYTDYNAGGAIQLLDEENVAKASFDIKSNLNKDLELKNINEAYILISIHSSYTSNTKGNVTVKSIRLEK